MSANDLDLGGVVRELQMSEHATYLDTPNYLAVMVWESST